MADRGFWDGRRVLLTGHTGFKGSWLALWLSRLGARVVGLSGPPPSTPSLYELAEVWSVCDDEHAVDVRDAAAVAEAVEAAAPEVVIHMAAQAIVRRSLIDPVETWGVNVLGTANLLQSVPADATVVVVTSDKCYRDVESGRPMREDDPLGGHDPYSASKAAQELVAASFREARDLKLATVRAGNVIGGGDWAADRLVPDLMRAATAGEPFTVRNPDAVRPWQHVLNPLSGYLLVAERAATGAWNFGPPADDEQPVGWLVERVQELWPGLQGRVERDAAHEARTLRLDSSAARSELGWEPVVGLQTGLAATVQWYRDQWQGASPRELTLRQIEEHAST